MAEPHPDMLKPVETNGVSIFPDTLHSVRDFKPLSTLLKRLENRLIVLIPFLNPVSKKIEYHLQKKGLQHVKHFQDGRKKIETFQRIYKQATWFATERRLGKELKPKSNMDVRTSYMFRNVYQVCRLFTTGLRQVEPGTQYVVELGNVPLDLYAAREPPVDHQGNVMSYKSFSTSFENHWTKIRLQANTCYFIPEKVFFVLIAPERSVFSFWKFGLDEPLSPSFHNAVPEEPTPERDLYDYPVRTPFVEDVVRGRKRAQTTHAVPSKRASPDHGVSEQENGSPASVFKVPGGFPPTHCPAGTRSEAPCHCHQPSTSGLSPSMRPRREEPVTPMPSEPATCQTTTSLEPGEPYPSHDPEPVEEEITRETPETRERPEDPPLQTPPDVPMEDNPKEESVTMTLVRPHFAQERQIVVLQPDFASWYQHLSKRQYPLPKMRVEFGGWKPEEVLDLRTPREIPRPEETPEPEETRNLASEEPRNLASEETTQPEEPRNLASEETTQPEETRNLASERREEETEARDTGRPPNTPEEINLLSSEEEEDPETEESVLVPTLTLQDLEDLEEEHIEALMRFYNLS